ncbi:MAG: glycosyltransferase family 61 protein, partial [Bacteroidia bacterium]|nr:glycosyltransferase family 61 protein [Bacteroidia bacterium]
TGYYHWMAETLPRILTIKDYLKKAILLFPEEWKASGFQLESLKPFNLNKVQFLPKNSIVKIQRLLMPTHTAASGYVDDDLIKELRSLYQKYYSKKCSFNFGERIYISRSKAKKRKIVNEDQVIIVVQKYGFKVIYFEDHSLEQTVQICKNAKCMISLHGAGLTNVMFMNKGGYVLEFIKSFKENPKIVPTIFNLSQALNINYMYQICEPENDFHDINKADLKVDISFLKRNVEFMLGKIK